MQLRMEDLRQLAAEMAGQGRGAATFRELAAEWLAAVAARRVCPENERRHVRHLEPLAELGEGELTPGRIELVLGELIRPTGPLGPSSCNKLLSTGRLVIRHALGNGRWRGANPFELVRRIREPRRAYHVLSVGEAVRMLRHIRRDRRELAKTMLLVGLRPGEALGLQKVDVDLGRGLLHVRRSHGRAQTKTGRERLIVIPDELLPDLRRAIERHPRSPYIFPRPDGTRQRHDTKLTRVLRTALADAGLVVGYRYACRRRGCGHREERREREVDGRCPACGFLLWETPLPRPLRWYDLRHCCATLHRQAGCDALVIAEMLGHAVGLTEGTYTHLDERTKRREVNRLKLR